MFTYNVYVYIQIYLLHIVVLCMLLIVNLWSAVRARVNNLHEKKRERVESIQRGGMEGKEIYQRRFCGCCEPLEVRRDRIGARSRHAITNPLLLPLYIDIYHCIYTRTYNPKERSRAI